jgi:WD40 repeat protein
MQKITFFDVNDEKVVALAGTAIEDPTMSRIIVKSLSSDAYLFSTTLAASVDGIALSPKGDKIAVWRISAVRVWNIASKSLLLVQETAEVVGVEFKGEGSLFIRTSEGEKTVQFGSIAHVAGYLSLTTEGEEDSLATE